MYKKWSSFNETYRFQYYLKKEKITTDLYIDSRDFLFIISGAKAFTKFSKFSQEEFKNNNILIHSLIFEKWLTNMKLLMPHEDEVLYNIEKFQNTLSSRVSDREEDEIIYHLEEILNYKVNDFVDLEASKIIEELNAKGSEVYKARYLLNLPGWRERFKYVVNEGIYNSDEEVYDFDEITSSDLFQKLLEDGFTKERKTSKNSNIVDTLVLCILKLKLEKFKLGEGALPIFYDYSNLFSKVIKSSGLEEEFTYSFHEKNQKVTASIIQDDSFLILQALQNQSNKQHPLISQNNYIGLREFQDIQSKLDRAVKNSEEKIEQKLINQFIQFIETKFIKVFWINREKETLDFIIKLKKKLNVTTVRKGIDEKIISIINSIKARTKYYSVFRSTYSILDSSTKLVRENFTEKLRLYSKNNRKLDIYRDYGLTRFSIYCDKRGILQLIVDDLFNDGDNKFTPNSIRQVCSSITNFYENQSIESQADLRIGIAVLWILGKYELIIEILEYIYLKYEFYSLGFFHAAALAKKGSQHSSKKAIKILEFLPTSHGSKYTYDSNYKMAIGASYIYYHIWEKNNDCNFRNTLIPCNIDVESNNFDKYFLCCTKYGEIAFKFLKKNNRYKKYKYRTNKYYYIINNMVYYITMGGNDEEFLNLKHKIDILESIPRGGNSHWQYRFSDTLSLYYLRLALLQPQENVSTISIYLLYSRKYNIDAFQMVLLKEDEDIIQKTSDKIERCIANHCDKNPPEKPQFQISTSIFEDVS